MDADNQQERLKLIGWIVGFIDGEGCFSISIFRNKTSKLGWQVFPELAVTQGKKSLSSLKLLKDFFGCGKIFVNRRHDNHKEDIYRYCVRSVKDLSEIIIPFFQENPLRTSKRKDFDLFVKGLQLIGMKHHLSHKGLSQIATLSSEMNRKKSSKFLESSETTRQTHSPKGEGKI